MKQRCPVCGTEHDSEDHDEGWFFVCVGLCGHLLVWRLRGDRLELEVADGDEYEYGRQLR